MFQVREKREDREKRIHSFLEQDAAIAVLLAAIHFEWSVKRAILKLSSTPTVELRKALVNVFRLDSYKEAWRQHVNAPRLTSVITNWQDVKIAFKLRNQIVHGTGGCSARYAAPRVRALIAAARDVGDYTRSQGHDLYSRLAARKNKR